MCPPVFKPSNEKLWLKREVLSQNEIIQDMIDDREVMELGEHPLPIPTGCWGIVIETKTEKIFYYVSEEIKQWHLYFFGPQLFITQQWVFSLIGWRTELMHLCITFTG